MPSKLADLDPIQLELLYELRDALDEFEVLVLPGSDLHKEQPGFALLLKFLQLLLAFFDAECIVMCAVQTLTMGLVTVLLELLPAFSNFVFEVDFELFEYEFVHSMSTINLIATKVNLILTHYKNHSLHLLFKIKHVSG